MACSNSILGSVRFTEDINCTWWLATTTVPEITVTKWSPSVRCTTKIVHIKGSTVSHFDVSGPVTAAIPVKTHLPGNLAIRHWRVATIQPAGCPSVTPASGRTCGCHPWPCGSFKSEPAGTKVTVTLPDTVSYVRLLAVSTAETSVILTFWRTEKGNNKTKWINKLVKENYHANCGRTTESTGQKLLVLISHRKESRKCNVSQQITEKERADI